MMDILRYLDSSVFAEISLILFGGVFTAVLIRVLRSPRQEMDTFSRMAMNNNETDAATSRQNEITGGRP